MFSKGPGRKSSGKNVRWNIFSTNTAPPGEFGLRQPQISLLSMHQWPTLRERWTIVLVEEPVGLCVFTLQDHARHHTGQVQVRIGGHADLFRRIAQQRTLTTADLRRQILNCIIIIMIVINNSRHWKELRVKVLRSIQCQFGPFNLRSAFLHVGYVVRRHQLHREGVQVVPEGLFSLR